MAGWLTSIPEGDAGVRRTLVAMTILTRFAALHPTVREVAADLVNGLASGSGLPQAEALKYWVGERTRFLPDPVHAEALHDPVMLLTSILHRGSVAVDCDDVAMLAAALGMSIGLRAQFVAVAFDSPNAPFRHVWTRLGRAHHAPSWVTVDPTRPAQGLANMQITRRLIVEV